jgi:uncharacterized protein with FMN-binding domain
MSSNTKIVVLRSKELVYALVFLVLSVLIIMAALSLFMPKKDKADDETYDNSNDNTVSMVSNTTMASNTTMDTETSVSDLSDELYIPGVYSSVVSLGNTNMELIVTVDYDHINSITMSNLDETIETLYPLMSPTLSELSAAILDGQSIDNISYSEENRYTSMLLMQAISDALDKARLEDTYVSETPEY